MMERAAQNPEFRKNFEKIPLGRPGEPEEVAAAVVYLASEAGCFVTGHTLLVDGGFTAVLCNKTNESALTTKGTRNTKRTD
jgi:NAD(P)-dependent dehydrogenase (short-subunit alcohol dehydrogenase family)